MYCDKEREHLHVAERVKEHELEHESVVEMCKIFHLLSEPSRLKIVLALFEGNMCVYHLTEVCGGTVSGVSHQLRLLRDNKIVSAKRLGKNIEYSLADNHVREIVEMALVHLQCPKE